MRIPYGDLVLSGALGAGAQGTIYRAQPNPDFGLPFPLIYKEFGEKTVVAGLSLELLARFRAELDDRDRAVLDLRSVWPAAVVEKAGRVCGYVMQEIPDAFMQTIHTTSGHQPIPREIQHLFVADALARKNVGEVPKRTERFALARETAYILGFLHKRELVFGDFSYKNAVYCLRPRPMVMLLDCDAVRRRGQGSAVAQLNSPGWGAPEKGPQTIESDRYKLGLFVLRCLTPGVNAQNRDPEKAAHVLDREGMALLRRAVGDDPAARPSGKEWVTYLDAHIAASGGVRQRTGRAAAPAAPPKLATQASTRGRRVTAPVAATAPQPVPVRGRPARTRAKARSTAGQPANTSRTWPPPAGGFGSPPTPRAWPGWVGSRGHAPRAVRASQTFSTTAMLGALLAVLIALFGVALAVSSSTNGPKGTTGGTLATLPPTSLATSPSSALAWPVDPAPLARAASTATGKVVATAGPGWEVSSFSSVGEVPPRTAGTTEVRPVWRVELTGPPAAAPAGYRQWRSYQIDAAGALTLVQDSVRPPRPDAALTSLAPFWPVALEKALDLTLTPARRAGIILVRFGCEAPDQMACAWELRFLRSAAQPTETDRTYVSADGQSTVPPPSWATPR